MNIANHKKTILIIIALLLAFFGYWYVFISNKDTSAQNGGQITNKSIKNDVLASGPVYSKEFVSSLAGFDSVKLDVSIFESKAYKALSYPEIPFVIDYSTDSGRDNPFLPIGIDGTFNNPSLQSQIESQPSNKTNTPSASTTVNVVAPATVPTTAPKNIPKPIQKTF